MRTVLLLLLLLLLLANVDAALGVHRECPPSDSPRCLRASVDAPVDTSWRAHRPATLARKAPAHPARRGAQREPWRRRGSCDSSRCRQRVAAAPTTAPPSAAAASRARLHRRGAGGGLRGAPRAGVLARHWHAATRATRAGCGARWACSPRRDSPRLGASVLQCCINFYCLRHGQSKQRTMPRAYPSQEEGTSNKRYERGPLKDRIPCGGACWAHSCA